MSPRIHKEQFLRFFKFLVAWLVAPPARLENRSQQSKVFYPFMEKSSKETRQCCFWNTMLPLLGLLFSKMYYRNKIKKQNKVTWQCRKQQKEHSGISVIFLRKMEEISQTSALWHLMAFTAVPTQRFSGITHTSTQFVTHLSKGKLAVTLFMKMWLRYLDWALALYYLLFMKQNIFKTISSNQCPVRMSSAIEQAFFFLSWREQNVLKGTGRQEESG